LLEVQYAREGDGRQLRVPPDRAQRCGLQQRAVREPHDALHLALDERRWDLRRLVV